MCVMCVCVVCVCVCVEFVVHGVFVVFVIMSFPCNGHPPCTAVAWVVPGQGQLMDMEGIGGMFGQEYGMAIGSVCLRPGNGRRPGHGHIGCWLSYHAEMESAVCLVACC